MKLDDERYRSVRIARPGFYLRRVFRRPTIDRALYRDPSLTRGERINLEAVMASAQRVFADRRLVFIFGIMPRSGTNFLFELLLRSPPFARSAISFSELPILAGEAYFEGPADLIGRVHPESAEAFARMEWMAYAVSGFRNRLLDLAAPGSVTLIKNPVVWNLELWPTLFPQDRMIYILRDLRYVVDSFARTFARKALSRTFEDVCVESALAAEKSLAFLPTVPAAKLLFLRFEDVVKDKPGTVARARTWLGEAGDAAAPDVLNAVPVFGSSTHSRHGDGAVHWAPVAADASFDPVDRPLDWTARQERIFERVCGALNRRLGYQAAAPRC